MNTPEQADVLQWAVDSFGEVAKNVDERAARLVEEAIEVAQAAGVKLAVIERIARRTYARPPGEVGQEIGGTGITLLAFAESVNCDFKQEIFKEWARVLSLPPEHWKRKHDAKIADGTANVRETPQHASWCSIYGVFDPKMQGNNPAALGKCNCKNGPPPPYDIAAHHAEITRLHALPQCQECGQLHLATEPCPV